MIGDVFHKLKTGVVDAGICVGCGACSALACPGQIPMSGTPRGVLPQFDGNHELPALAWEACPGKGIDYPDLYQRHYGGLPDNWLIGRIKNQWTGHAADPLVRRAGASGGVLSAVLIFLLETGKVDAVIVAKQGVPSPEEAHWFIARSKADILACAQSVYVPVAMLDVLPALVPGEKYAITLVPEQSAALRVLQHAGHEQACQISHVLGPYTGTALEPAAIRALMRANGVPPGDPVISLHWRAGEWPGYLEIRTESGREIRSKKVYYNFLIPFFITQASLQSMDFANEFADLAAGDAWSPKFEMLGQGHSVLVSRTSAMNEILKEMMDRGDLCLTGVAADDAAAMHGHMIDFKKRGGYLRNRWRSMTGRKAPDYGLHPSPLGVGRILVEVVISSVFGVCRTGWARRVMEIIPEAIMGPVFNHLRLAWKSASKPAKRRGLGGLRMDVVTPAWRKPA